MLSRAPRSIGRQALAVAAVCGGLLTVAAPADAGIYTVIQCNASLSPTQGDAVAEQTSFSYALGANCASSGGLQVTKLVPGNPADTYGRWVWRAPSGTVFTALAANASLVSGGGEVARLVGVSPAGENVVFGTPGAAYEPADQVAGEFSELRSELRCVTGPCAGSGAASIRDVLLTTDDRAAPTVAITGGSMFEDAAVRGRRQVEFTVSDEGGGVNEVTLRVNGRPVFADALGCQVVGEIATSLRPCAAQVTPRVQVPTGGDPFATGANLIAACGSDLALDGLANEGCEERQVFVDDICPSSRIGAGAELGGRLGSGKARATVRSDKRARVEGKLTSDSGDGIRGAKVCALTHVKLEDGAYEVADTDTTGAGGRYSLRLPPGPSREIFVHRVFGDEVLARHGLELTARVRPAFEISPGAKSERVEQGGRLRFKGSLPGPNCTGRSVKVQAKVGKRRWQVFRSVRTNGKCRYRTRFKLRETGDPTRFVFRARVPEQPDYPYKAGVSTVRVRVAGGAD